MTEKVMKNNGGTLTETVVGVTTSGAGNAGLLIATDSAGLLPVGMLPVGIGAPTKQILASESLAAGAVVNVWSNAGVANVRNADGSVSGKPVDGFVLAAVASGAMATVYFSGVNNSLTGLTPGSAYFLSATTAGAVSTTAPSGSGQTVQRVGTAVSATELPLEKLSLYVLA